MKTMNTVALTVVLCYVSFTLCTIDAHEIVAFTTNPPGKDEFPKPSYLRFFLKEELKKYADGETTFTKYTPYMKHVNEAIIYEEKKRVRAVAAAKAAKAAKEATDAARTKTSAVASDVKNLDKKEVTPENLKFITVFGPDDIHQLHQDHTRITYVTSIFPTDIYDLIEDFIDEDDYVVEHFIQTDAKEKEMRFRRAVNSMIVNIMHHLYSLQVDSEKDMIDQEAKTVEPVKDGLYTQGFDRMVCAFYVLFKLDKSIEKPKLLTCKAVLRFLREKSKIFGKEHRDVLRDPGFVCELFVESYLKYATSKAPRLSSIGTEGQKLIPVTILKYSYDHMNEGAMGSSIASSMMLDRSGLEYLSYMTWISFFTSKPFPIYDYIAKRIKSSFTDFKNFPNIDKSLTSIDEMKFMNEKGTTCLDKFYLTLASIFLVFDSIFQEIQKNGTCDCNYQTLLNSKLPYEIQTHNFAERVKFGVASGLRRISGKLSAKIKKPAASSCEY